MEEVEVVTSRALQQSISILPFAIANIEMDRVTTPQNVVTAVMPFVGSEKADSKEQEDRRIERKGIHLSSMSPNNV